MTLVFKTSSNSSKTPCWQGLSHELKLSVIECLFRDSPRDVGSFRLASKECRNMTQGLVDARRASLLRLPIPEGGWQRLKMTFPEESTLATGYWMSKSTFDVASNFTGNVVCLALFNALLVRHSPSWGLHILANACVLGALIFAIGTDRGRASREDQDGVSFRAELLRQVAAAGLLGIPKCPDENSTSDDLRLKHKVAWEQELRRCRDAAKMQGPPNERSTRRADVLDGLIANDGSTAAVNGWVRLFDEVMLSSYENTPS